MVPEIICDAQMNGQTSNADSIGPFGLQPGTNNKNDNNN